MEKADVIIIGAGLLGSFAARALTAYDAKVIVLEAREDVCTGVSRANTGIIYAGYDTKPGSLKTTLSVRANRSFGELCSELSVPFRRCGSLMIGCGERAEGVIRRKLSDGEANGVEGLQLLSGSEARALEPNLTNKVTLALYAPQTGTVNPWELGIAAYENARANGAEFHLRSKVVRITRDEGGFVVETENASFRAGAVLNCAGLKADTIREMLYEPKVRLFPSAADYIVLDTAAGGFVKHIISHEPEKKGKSLTLIPTVDGNLLVGPTERDITDPRGTPTTIEGLQELQELCSEIVPDLDLGMAIRTFGSHRPNPYYVSKNENGDYVPEEKGISSFTVLEEEGLFSLIGIKTPGLTCCRELGEYVTEKITSYLGITGKNPSFSPVRRGIIRVKELSEEERALFVKANPEYGSMVCRCMEISRGEVLEAIRRGAVTTDGVKRRVGAGMGRCQGGYCLQRIVEILASEQNIPAEKVLRDASGTEVLRGTL